MNSNCKTLILKVTQDCNLRCDYCYYENNKHIMSFEVAQKTILQFSLNYKLIYIVFHGGEPLLISLPFYKKIINYQQELEKTYGTRFVNIIQTNGTIYTKSISSFLKKNNFKIGVSIDGLKESHDKHRLYKNGDGSFDKVFANTRNYINDGNVVTALVVLNYDVIKSYKELYYFFRAEKINFQINELIGISEHSPSQTELGEFYCNIFDLWFEDRSCDIINIIPITDIIISLFNSGISYCTHINECYNYFSIETNGDVYVCDNYKFSDKSLKLGNINTSSIKSILTHELISKFKNRRSRLPIECFSCKWESICCGGCSASALIDNEDINNKTYWCESRKLFFEYIYNRINNL